MLRLSRAAFLDRVMQARVCVRLTTPPSFKGGEPTVGMVLTAWLSGEDYHFSALALTFPQRWLVGG